MKKVIIDASIIDGSWDQFEELARDNVIILTNLTHKELERCKVVQTCSEKNRIFAKRLLKYVALQILNRSGRVELVKLEEAGYVDQLLVNYAKSVGASIYTGDYGMVVAAAFEDVEVIFAEHILRERLDFVIDGVLDLQLIPRGESIFAISKDGEKKKSWDYQVKLFEGDCLLRAMEDEDTGSWMLVEYEVLPGRVISKSRERSDGDGKEPFCRYDQELIDKWLERRQKNF